MKVTLTRSALLVAATAFASVFTPPADVTPSVWANEHLILGDGDYAGEKMKMARMPHLVEPLDMLGPDSGVNEMASMKSAQTGFSYVLIAAISHSIACDPCDMMLVQPSEAALEDFNKDKLSRVIENSLALKEKVYDQVSRSSKGSTASALRFRGGVVSMTIASSSKDLRSKTRKKVFLDEVDDYPDDLDKQGSALAMAAARQTAFLAGGEWKRAYISTPTLKGMSKIEALYEAGDQRRWHVTCPHCGEEFVFEFNRELFKFNDTYPYESEYHPPCCGAAITSQQKLAITLRGRWIATAPGPGKYPSYHFDALSSPLVPWDDIAKEYCRVAALGDPSEWKTFYNLTLGLPYEMTGDTPDHVRLMERRSPDLPRGHIPPWGLILVASGDVQGNGIWVEVKAYGKDRQRAVVDVLWISGGTEDPQRGAFAELSEVYARTYADAFGNRRAVDLFGVDAGYRSHVVYTWCRNHPKAMALDGLDGWNRPPIAAIPKKVDIDLGGKRIKKGAELWSVGTYSLKATFYTDLHKEGVISGQPHNPPGYCHFGTWIDEEYFKQITAEYLTEPKKLRGRMQRSWDPRPGRENHLLDCAIYNDALAHHLGLDRMKEADWQYLARVRGVPLEALAPDFFAPEPIKVAAAQPAPVSKPKPADPPASDGDRLDRRDQSSGGWFDRGESWWKR